MLFSFISATIPDAQYKNAADTSAKAILEYPEIKNDLNYLSKEGERVFLKYSPLTEQELAYAAYAGPLLTGQITTKPLTGLKYTFKNGFTIRPLIEYNYRTDYNFNGILLLTKEL